MTRALALAVLMSGCVQAGDAPARIAWDRDTCRGCGMALSDRHFAVQVRGGPKNATEKFDDVGCAVKWLEKQSWANEPKTRIWVARSTDGEWLDAKMAKFVKVQHTPMGFGWGAVDATESGIDFDTLQARITGSTP